MDRGIPTEEVLAEMRAADPPVSYLVGTPKGRLSKLEKHLVPLPWQAVRERVDVKLLPHPSTSAQDQELFVLAQSHARRPCPASHSNSLNAPTLSRSKSANSARRKHRRPIPSTSASPLLSPRSNTAILGRSRSDRDGLRQAQSPFAQGRRPISLWPPAPNWFRDPLLQPTGMRKPSQACWL
jgi:hypothetical protein